MKTRKFFTLRRKWQILYSNFQSFIEQRIFLRSVITRILIFYLHPLPFIPPRCPSLPSLSPSLPPSLPSLLLPHPSPLARIDVHQQLWLQLPLCVPRGCMSLSSGRAVDWDVDEGAADASVASQSSTQADEYSNDRCLLYRSNGVSEKETF